MVQSAEVTQSRLCSFEDALLNDMSAEAIRQIRQGGEYSIAKIRQVFRGEDWASKMDEQSLVGLSDKINIQCLCEYWAVVARRIRQIVQ